MNFIFKNIRTLFICGIFSSISAIGFAQQCNIIYVTPTGTGTGTQASPSSLANAFILVSPTNNIIWLAVGNYSISNELPLISGATLEGGFDPNNNWQKTNSQQSIIYRDASNVDPTPNRIVAVECSGISNFNINDITIVTADAAGTSVSNYGVHIDNCSDYILARLTVTSGNATDGIGGVAGADGVNGANGIDGQGDINNEDNNCCRGGGAGASPSFSGGNAGGNGGDGGQRGTGCWPFGCNDFPGSPGQSGSGSGAGNGGNGGVGQSPCLISVSCDAGPAQQGGNGTDGGDGVNGTDGTNGNPAYSTYFIPGDGQNGQQGQHGSSGGGGGGSASQGGQDCFSNNNGVGAGGGGGAEGGQGGFGATGGTGGGGSFGIYIDANGANSFLKDAVLNSGLQGIGGFGGTPGGNGGQGGFGGQGGHKNNPCDIGSGGNGGAGGKGGKGGNGGNGAPGASLPFSENSNGAAIAQSDMKATVEPAVYVQNTGCTYHDINYVTNATGIIQWFFDGGSAPLSATGDSVLTQYTSMGRHSITLVVDGVPYMLTDFTGIFSDGTPFLSSITGPDTVCPGSSGTFSATFPSVFTVTGYNWKLFSPPATAPLQTGTGTTFTYLFPATGTYLLTLQTESQCCGWSKVDSFYIQVVPYLTADVFVSATAATICDGETSTFFAIPINGGSNPSYQWNVNGTNTGITTSSFSSSTFNDNDTITCIMTSSYPCPLNSPDTSLPFTIKVNPLPTVNPCTTSGAYLGANTSFSAPATGTAPFSYSWDFGDGGVDTAASPTHLFGGTGIFTYSVSVTDSNGCTGVCTNTVDIIIAPLVDAGFSFNSTVICGSTTVNFSDTSLGIDPLNPLNSWLWDFGDGTTDTVQNPTHVYTSAGIYSVTLTASNGVFTDTYFGANMVTVKFVPAANISYITDTVCFPLGAQFFDISSGSASWNWDFGDGNITCCNIQNPFHVYNIPGNYTVTLTATSTDTCTATASATIYVLPAPVADFTLSDTAFCSADGLVITDNSDDAVKWNWSFGNGNIDFTNSPPTQYYSPGWYPVYLSVENQYGCTDDATRWIQVLLSPAAAFSINADSICSVNSLTVTNSSSSDVTSWDWDFGDGTTDATQFPPPHYYSNNSTQDYLITLIVENYDFCTDTLIDTVTVLTTPLANLSMSTNVICAGQSVTFTDNSDGFGSTIVEWIWDFGDGNSDTAQTPADYTYGVAGNYIVSLSIVNNVGCPDDTVLTDDTVKVKPQPTALFDPDTTEILFPDNDIVLTNLSTTSNGSQITSWLWNFGNETFDSANFNATAVYPDSGNYTIILYALYEDLCIDSFSVDVRVIDIEAIYFSNSFTPNADGINDVFYIYGNNIPELKLYIFDRWGDVIFTSEDRSLAAQGKFAGWDGKVKGAKAPDGIYPFKVEYKLNSTKNKLHTKIGSLMMLGKK